MNNCQVIIVGKDGTHENKMMKIESVRRNNKEKEFTERDKIELIKDQVVAIMDLLFYEMMSVEDITPSIVEKIYQRVLSIENDDFNILAIKEILKSVIYDRLAETERISGINDTLPYAYSEKFICADNFSFCRPIVGNDSDSENDDNESSEMVGIYLQFKIMVPILLEQELLIYPFGNRLVSTFILGLNGGSLKAKNNEMECNFFSIDGEVKKFSLKGTLCNKNGKYAILLDRRDFTSEEQRSNPFLVSYSGTWHI